MRIRVLALLLAAFGLTTDLRAQETGMPAHEYAKGTIGAELGAGKTTGSRLECVDGRAGAFPCENVDLMAFMPIPDLGGSSTTRLNDIWGWTDSETGREYALVGRSDGTAFVDVSDPVNPVFLGSLPSVGGAASSWRDIKTIGDYALVVMDRSSGGVRHGVQIFDLTQLRDVIDPPQAFSETAHYTEFIRAHNIVVDDESGFAYAVGSETCGGGLHIIDVRDPLNPTFAGCFAENGYTHDAQCVTYDGPDDDYRGREICIGSNASHVVFVDVSDKTNIERISTTTYPGVQYTHQAWLTPDHRYLFLDDELDELGDAAILTTRTLIFDVIDLDDPQLVTEYFSTATSSDHNQYIHGDRTFQANYTSGLRVLDISDVENPIEVGFFDTYPADNEPGFQGAWSNYPFFESGIVIVSSIREGLFVLEPRGPAKPPVAEIPESFELVAAYPNPFNPNTTIRLAVDQPQHVRVTVYDVQGREVAVLHDGFVESVGVREMTFHGGRLASGVYVVRAVGASSGGSLTVTLQK